MWVWKNTLDIFAQNIEDTKGHDKKCFSLACNKTTDITNNNLAIFVCVITAKFATREDFLSLQAMRGMTEGED